MGGMGFIHAAECEIMTNSALLGWSAKYTVRDGIAETYPWIEEQVRQAGS